MSSAVCSQYVLSRCFDTRAKYLLRAVTLAKAFDYAPGDTGERRQACLCTCALVLRASNVYATIRRDCSRRYGALEICEYVSVSFSFASTMLTLDFLSTLEDTMPKFMSAGHIES